MSEKNKYSAEDIKVLEGLEGVRRRPSMYVGSTGKDGLHHLVYEVVDNSIDEAMAGFCDTVIIKLGKKGSLIKHDGKVYQIPCVKAKAIDTTGAGDAYAAGILYGLANDCDIEIAGEIGSLIAAKVVEKIGARLDDMPYREIEKIKNKK